jgi:simple sugar transport system ATP-binding protein
MQLELRGITKQFGSLTANDHISLTVEPGQIHSLLGENGAGKSTLMNVLFGLLHPDDGEILIDGEVVKFADSGDAVRRGIGMVHQHFMLVPVFSVAENVVLGFEPTKRLVQVDYKKANKDIRELSRQFKLEVDPDAIVESLPVGIQQRVEILKALSHDAELLILDEPTAVLTPQEIDALMAIMRSLADAGKSILFITHKLKEVKAIADVITVIRLGKVVGTAEPSASEAELATMMVGRAVQLVVEKSLYLKFATLSCWTTVVSSLSITSRSTCEKVRCWLSRASRVTVRRSSSKRWWACATWSQAQYCCTAKRSPTAPHARRWTRDSVTFPRIVSATG